MTNSKRNSSTRLEILIAGILISWFLLALAGSWLGVFDNPNRPPLLIGAAAALPVVVFLVWHGLSNGLRQFLQGADLRLLTVVQTGRLAGVLFLMLYLQGALPGMFALPAGWGDIAIGATAPLVTWAMAPGTSMRKDFFVGWNILGMLDLVTAVTLGVLGSGAFFGSSAGAITTAAMGRFPMSLIPTFFVPLYLILHIISLSRVQSATFHSVAANTQTV